MGSVCVCFARASHLLAKHSTTELYLQPDVILKGKSLIEFLVLASLSLVAFAAHVTTFLFWEGDWASFDSFHAQPAAALHPSVAYLVPGACNSFSLQIIQPSTYKTFPPQRDLSWTQPKLSAFPLKPQDTLNFSLTAFISMCNYVTVSLPPWTVRRMTEADVLSCSTLYPSV